MTKILTAVSPRDDRGNDPNDFRDDCDYLRRVLESAVANGKPAPAPPAETLSGAFRYLEHRTTTKGRLVLDFVHEDTGQVVSLFFNVDLKNPKTGRQYRAGRGGQFTTRPRHKIRMFWDEVFDQPPFRWCRAHTELHRLSKVALEGKAINAGKYWNLIEITKC